MEKSNDKNDDLKREDLLLDKEKQNQIKKDSIETEKDGVPNNIPIEKVQKSKEEKSLNQKQDEEKHIQQEEKETELKMEDNKRIKRITEEEEKIKNLPKGETQDVKLSEKSKETTTDNFSKIDKKAKSKLDSINDKIPETQEVRKSLFFLILLKLVQIFSQTVQSLYTICYIV